MKTGSPGADLRMRGREGEGSVNAGSSSRSWLAGSPTAHFGPYTFEWSHLDREVYPGGKGRSSLTKEDLLRHYERVAERMLPFLEDRVVNAVRVTDRLEDAFYQRRIPKSIPEWVRTVPVERRGDDSEQERLVCGNEATLAYLVNHGAVEFHAWASRVDRPDRPDRCVFDLDPAEDGDFGLVRRAAFGIRELLASLELPSWVMTTGSRGLHVVVPLARKETFEEVRAFALAVSSEAAERSDDRFTTEPRLEARRGRLYLDVGSNAYAQTTVVPYSLRARPAAPVATPIRWEELAKDELRSDTFELEGFARRLRQPDPWAGWRRRARSLKAAMKELGVDP